MTQDALVQPLYDRELDSVPGPFYVIRDRCILCALPPETAPQNISWDEPLHRSGCAGCPNHCRVEHQPETPEQVERVIEAACGSCVEAIRYCGTDSGIITRFRELGSERLCDAVTKSVG